MPVALLTILPWLKRFGPWIAVILIAIGVYAASSTIVRDWKRSIHDAAYADGRDTERARQDAIARKIEKTLGPKLDAIDAKTGKDLATQSKKETQYVDRIHTQINSDTRYHACSIDDGMLHDRNAIRSSLGTANDPASGTGSIEAPATPATNN